MYLHIYRYFIRSFFLSFFLSFFFFFFFFFICRRPKNTKPQVEVYNVNSVNWNVEIKCKVKSPRPTPSPSPLYFSCSLFNCFQYFHFIYPVDRHFFPLLESEIVISSSRRGTLSSFSLEQTVRRTGGRAVCVARLAFFQQTMCR